MTFENNASGDAEPKGQSAFPVTRWTLIEDIQSGIEEDSSVALNEICRAYWYPLYLTARRKRGLDHHDAEDLTQSFWSWLMEKRHLENAQPEKGKFRNFLVGYFDNYLRNELRAATAQKRGGGTLLISRDETFAYHEQFEAEIETFASPDEHLERAWLRAHMEAAFKEIGAQWRAHGRAELFQALKDHLKSGAERGGYRNIAQKFDLSEPNVRQYARVLRQDLRAVRDQWRGDG